MRISDWSSDVCSSDLCREHDRIEPCRTAPFAALSFRDGKGAPPCGEAPFPRPKPPALQTAANDEREAAIVHEIGSRPPQSAGREHLRGLGDLVGQIHALDADLDAFVDREHRRSVYLPGRLVDARSIREDRKSVV